MSFFESLFELLFKYPASIYSAGTFGFAPSRTFLVAALVLLALGIPVLVRYGRVGRGARDRVLVALRLVLLLLVVAVLARPILSVSTLVPLQSFVGVLVDDSASMGVEDGSGRSRAQLALELLGTEEEGLLATLGERFKVRLLSFSEDATRVESTSALTFRGQTSHLGRGIERAVDELATLPLAGLVVLTDGADNSGGSLDDTILDLKARSLPVFTVGFGAERFDHDIQISRVEAPRSVLRGSSLVVEVTLEQQGFDGESVSLEVEDDGRIVSTRQVRFSDTGEAAVARVNFEATEAGPREFNFRVAPQRGEVLTKNNQRSAMIQVVNRVEKILYFEGEPRWELKFLRRAVSDDDNLQLVVLQRTAENRFLRFGLDTEDELEGGFPTSREELFRYRALILGSIEASFFTYDQLRMIADFVSVRGGGLLMIGGHNAFSEGGWAGTPVADALPVVLGPAPEDERFFSLLKVELTPAGRTHPVTRLASSEEGSEEVWKSLPLVSTFNPLSELKAGATSLLVGTGDGLVDEQIVLASQRYGRGRGLAWSVHDSWKWQMDAEIPLEDMSHERLWRQIMRWLVSYVPDPVNLASTSDQVGIGKRVALLAEVMDEDYLDVNNADVTAEVVSPAGIVIQVPMRWTVEADGQYEGSFLAEEEGTYSVSYSAGSGEGVLGDGEAFVRSAVLDQEYFDAELRRPLLENLAEETGGRYYEPREARRVVQDLSLRGGGSMMIDRYELWDMPILFLLVISLLALEWGLRRRAGMV